MEFARLVFVVAAKDLRAELRTKEAINASAAFALVILLLFSFAFDLDPDTNREIASGLLHRCSGGRAGRAVRGLSPAGYCGSSVTAAARLNEAHVQHGNAAPINSGDPD